MEELITIDLDCGLTKEDLQAKALESNAFISDADIQPIFDEYVLSCVGEDTETSSIVATKSTCGCEKTNKYIKIAAVVGGIFVVWKALKWQKII